MGRSVRLKSFELVARDIREVDVKLLHALSIAVGWPHRPKDWDFLRRAGQGIVAVDGIGRVFGSAMWFPHGRKFATIGLVLTSPRTQAQGTGRWLMEQVFERCGNRNLVLNSTDAAYHLYLSLGFRKEAVVYLWQGEVASSLPAVPVLDGELRSLSAEILRRSQRWMRIGIQSHCCIKCFVFCTKTMIAQPQIFICNALMSVGSFCRCLIVNGATFLLQ